MTRLACECCGKPAGEVRSLDDYCPECEEAGCRYELACLVEVRKLDEGEAT